ncbi:MAG TPA: ATP-binding cassette domain-containing protein [Edaphobacter sp.]|nr:ATP-binding cassette domain-containing protein [Edaphobacter sp.]
MSASLLSLSLQHRVGGLSMDVAFTLTHPWTVLFGPSGSGKTTVLRAIAGFLKPEEAGITYGPTHTVLIDTRKRIFVPAHQRPVRSAGQAARLFPHQSVRQNLAYGMGSDTKKEETSAAVDEIISLFQLEELADRRPDALSGGERQRVSVARAVGAARAYPGPEKPLLLLDEPFTGLDARLRDELLQGLREWLARWEVPVLSVTHALGEAFQLGAEVIKIADGRVVRQGPVAVVLEEERNRLLKQLRSE